MSSVTRHWTDVRGEGICHFVPCILLHLSTNICFKINYVDAKYAPYIILYFEGCGRVKKSSGKSRFCYDFRCHKSKTRLREFMPSSYTTDSLQKKKLGYNRGTVFWNFLSAYKKLARNLVKSVGFFFVCIRLEMFVSQTGFRSFAQQTSPHLTFFYYKRLAM
jgi:hypothetical protein